MREWGTMKTNNVPALVMLSAGFIDCVIAIRTGQSLWSFTKQLLLVLILFYILGSIIKVVLDRNFGEMDDFEDVDLGETVEPSQTQEKEDAGENAETDEPDEAQE